MKNAPESRMLAPDRTEEHNTHTHTHTHTHRLGFCHPRECWFPTAQRSTTRRFRALSARTIYEKSSRVEDASPQPHRGSQHITLWLSRPCRRSRTATSFVYLKMPQAHATGSRVTPDTASVALVGFLGAREHEGSCPSKLFIAEGPCER